MNTNKQQNQRRQAPVKPGSRKPVRKPNALPANQKYHEQERIETRMFD
jgi:hypothetical protein